MRLLPVVAAGLLALVSVATPASVFADSIASINNVDATTALAAKSWQRTELYFGIGRWHGRQAARDEKRWEDFLDREVTPRFPDGLTVLDAYGQWLRSGNAQPQREHTKLLVILHENTDEHSADLDAIRVAWKLLTGDASVLRADSIAEVSF